MEPINPQNPPAPAANTNPPMPEPLNTSAQTPTGMPMGVPMQPQGGTPEGGLPTQLPVADPKGGGSKKMMFILFGVVLIILLGAGGYYYYATQMKAEPVPEVADIQPDPVIKSLGTEAESIEVSDPEADLMEVDKEIKLLEATPAASITPKR